MITMHPAATQLRQDRPVHTLHRAPRQTCLRLPLSGATITRIADPVIEVRDGSGDLLGVLPWARRDVGSLLGGWSGRTRNGAPWSVAVGFGFPGDGLTVRFQRQHAWTSFLTPVTGWVEFMDNSDLGSPWAAEVSGDFAAVSLVSGDVRDVRGLALLGDHAA